MRAQSKIRYFETLNAPNEVCEACANTLLQNCGVSECVSKPTNCFRQTGNDCVWWVLHYVEVEARMEHGEGQGTCLSIGHNMRNVHIKQRLRLASQQLEAARLKWLEEEKAIGPG